MPPILSHVQVAPLLKMTVDEPQTVQISADLNQTHILARLDQNGLILNNIEIPRATLAKIADSENNSFLITETGEAEKIVAFSEVTNRYYSLYPTRSAPTMLVAGFPMHRIKQTDPHKDALEKVRALRGEGGRILDVCTGLGYTVIELAKSAEKVTTIELDPAAQTICRRNPWSQQLFTSPKVEQHIGDSYDVVQEFADGQFNAILHDPPTFRLEGDLYSAEFYTHLHRILTRNGRLFHYIGDPESRSGRAITRGVIERLQKVGFRRVTRQPRAHGVLAKK